MTTEERAALEAAMRADWDRRAREDAERAVYTRDAAGDVAGFDASGEANYNQLVRPYTRWWFGGRPLGNATVVEIGCGLGRMTRAFAARFKTVYAVDVSDEMLRQARERLTGAANIAWTATSGSSLTGIAGECADLVFSYIVLQHVPDKAIVAGYAADAARVLRAGGVLKLQVHGAPGDGTPHDTWNGVRFTLPEARELLERSGFSLIAREGEGTQYMTLTARRGGPDDVDGSYLLPGEAWAGEWIRFGVEPPVDQSYSRIAAHCGFTLAAPAQPGVLTAALYFWPEESFPTRSVAMEANGIEVAEFLVSTPGDHLFEAPVAHAGRVEVALRCTRDCRPALRFLGFGAAQR